MSNFGNHPSISWSVEIRISKYDSDSTDQLEKQKTLVEKQNSS